MKDVVFVCTVMEKGGEGEREREEGGNTCIEDGESEREYFWPYPGDWMQSS